jgi:hypothetical protein
MVFKFCFGGCFGVQQAGVWLVVWVLTSFRGCYFLLVVFGMGKCCFAMMFWCFVLLCGSVVMLAWCFLGFGSGFGVQQWFLGSVWWLCFLGVDGGVGCSSDGFGGGLLLWRQHWWW